MRVVYFVLLILESAFIDPFREIPYFNKFNTRGERVWLTWRDFWDLSRPSPRIQRKTFCGGVGARSRKHAAI
jgi:hypothetical protein